MSTLNVDSINEYTSAGGVTVDGVLIKDNKVDGIDVSKTSLVHLNTTTVASGDAVSALSVENVFSATYTNYRIVTTLYTTNTSDTICYIRFKSGSTVNTSTYVFSQMYQRLGVNQTGQEQGQGTIGAYFGYLRPRYDVDNTNGGTNHAVANIIDPMATTHYPGISFQAMFTRSGGSFAGWGYTGYSVLINQSALDGLQFNGASGNIYGTVKVYGIGDG